MIIPYWRQFLKRAYSNWVQYAQAVFGLFSMIDPSAALAVWQMMPMSVSSRVPSSFVAVVGAVLFIWSLVTIIFRLIRQPCLQISALEAEKRDA